LINGVRERTTDIEMRDQGCMLRAYRRPVVDAVVRSGAVHTFIPALAYTFASRPTEVGVRHAERHAGRSNYSLSRLIRLNFDLITGFSLAPLQYFTIFALLCAVGSGALLLALAVQDLFLAAARDGSRVLVGLLCFLVSMTMVGVGLVGEYVGRACQSLRSRRPYHVRETLDARR
jgi:undecaprenyl-phosphate 4-deoxy-4-formamido-L-arabinose transferase